jgi:hypothetical protein
MWKSGRTGFDTFEEVRPRCIVNLAESDYHRTQGTRDAGLQGFPQPRKDEPTFSIRSKYPDHAECSHEPGDAALVGTGGYCYLAARPLAVFQNVRNTKFRRHVNRLGYPVRGRQLEQWWRFTKRSGGG